MALAMCVAVAGLPGRGLAWGIKHTHRRLTDTAVKRIPDLDRFLRDVYGLEEGIETGLQLRPGLGPPEVDAELQAGLLPPFDSRFTRSWSLVGDGGPYSLAPEDSRLKRCDADEPCPQDVLQLLRIGATAEDNPNIRASHHFHDPVKEHGPPTGNSPPPGNQGLDNRGSPYYGWLLGAGAASVTAIFRGGGFFSLVGRSARDRALDIPLDGSFPSSAAPDNFFSLADAETYLYRAISASTDEERSHAMGLHFLAVGAALHLIEDMTSPAHVRNDLLADHVLPELTPDALAGISLESAGDTREFGGFLETSFGKGATLLPSLPVAALPLDLRSGYDLQIPLLGASGFDAIDFWDVLTARVNAHFFSRATVDDRPFVDGKANPPGYWSPAVPPCAVEGEEDESASGGPASRTFTRRLPERNLVTGQLEQAAGGGLVSGLFVSSPLVPHVARCPNHATPPPGAQIIDRSEWLASAIDPSVQRDYLEILWPLAIDAAEKFLLFYFSPRLEVVPIAPGQFRLRNRSQLEFRADATAVEVAYEVSEEVAAAGSRTVVPIDCGADEIVLPPAPAPGGVGPLSAAVCEMPLSLTEPPADATSFWVVARGKLGERGQVATRDELLGEQASFVVAFDRVLPQLLLFLHQGPDLGPDEDLRNDIWALDVDLAATLPEGEDNEIADYERLENLTERLRGADGSPLLDFVVPAAEPLGTRIALWSDRDASYATGSPSGVAAPLRLYLYDPFEEPPSLVSIPSGEVETQPDHWFLPRWSDDGEALFFRAPGQARYRVASQTGESFDSEEAFSTSNDDAPEVLEIGDEQDVCSRIDFLSARDAAQVVVSTLCRRERVTHKEELITGGFRIDWSPITPTKREVRIAVVETSLREPSRLHARLTHRVDVASATLVACGGEPSRCWERSGEPSGEESAEELSPVWAPDGSRFAFLRDPTGGNDGALASGGEELWVADVGTRNLRRVLTRNWGDLYRLAWHPSGEGLLVGLATADRYDVVTVDPDGPDSQVPGRLARFRNQGSSRFSLYAPLLLPFQGP